MKKPLEGITKIPIVVDGHSANIIHIQEIDDILSVEVFFDSSVEKLLGFSVHIPLKDYSEAELVKAVIKSAKKKLQQHIREMKIIREVIKEIEEERQT